MHRVEGLAVTHNVMDTSKIYSYYLCMSKKRGIWLHYFAFSFHIRCMFTLIIALSPDSLHLFESFWCYLCLKGHSSTYMCGSRFFRLHILLKFATNNHIRVVYLQFGKMGFSAWNDSPLTLVTSISHLSEMAWLWNILEIFG